MVERRKIWDVYSLLHIFSARYTRLGYAQWEYTQGAELSELEENIKDAYRMVVAVRDDTWQMKNEFTAIIEKDDDWCIAYYPEIPGANGQGKTIEECKVIYQKQ